MEKYIIEGYEFLKHKIDNANFIFSTSTNNLNFNIKTEEGQKKLNALKKWFNIKEVGYLKQVHSNLVYNYDGEIHQGDGLITARKNIGVGVFTADCVPVLIFDKTVQVVAAVHSGWKGTLNEVVVNTLSKLKSEYGCKMKNLVVSIGPHNRGCCYEVGEEVIELFQSKEIYKDMEIIKGNMLNLENCIIAQLLANGVGLENIITMDICTYCNENTNLYSYRKEKEDYGRMFSFIYMS